MSEPLALTWRHSGNGLIASAFGISVFYQIVGHPGCWDLVSPGKAGLQYDEGYGSQAAAKRAAYDDLKTRLQLHY
ncbi:MAG: hypothetical protein N4A53_08305 [Pelagimonas sp.]|jgi:hypothetical protein|nr:hypothetical protein [Pelagimonas sp.]